MCTSGLAASTAHILLVVVRHADPDPNFIGSIPFHFVVDTAGFRCEPIEF